MYVRCLPGYTQRGETSTASLNNNKNSNSSSSSSNNNNSGSNNNSKLKKTRECSLYNNLPQITNDVTIY